MNVLAVNGSPRKHWNTAILLGHALEGAKSAGARAELVHVYDITFKGCLSCFACKELGGKSYGRCAVKDALTPLLDLAAAADVLILGSPVYFGAETGQMRTFLERLLFPSSTYTPEGTSLFPRRIPTALLYTMNAQDRDVPARGYDAVFERTRSTMARIFGVCEVLLATDTLQFDDYSKYLSTRFDPAAKAKRRAEVFPQDCAKARALGERLAAPKAG